jgi:hypothetical protein
MRGKTLIRVVREVVVSRRHAVVFVGLRRAEDQTSSRQAKDLVENKTSTESSESPYGCCVLVTGGQR